MQCVTLSQYVSHKLNKLFKKIKEIVLPECVEHLWQHYPKKWSWKLHSNKQFITCNLGPTLIFAARYGELCMCCLTDMTH